MSRKALALLLTVLSVCFCQNDFLSSINEYDRCSVINDPDTPNYIAFMWSINANTLNMAVSVRNQGGYVAIGFSKINELSMVPSDAILGTRNTTTNTSTINDYDLLGQSVCNPANGLGVCSDASKGFPDNINYVDWIEGNGVTTMKFSRLLNTGDSEDVVIANSDMAMIWSTGRNYNILQHNKRGYFTMNLFSTDMSCPSDCNGNGNCTKGCCVCDPGWSGIDCTVGSNPNPPASQLTPEIEPADYKFTQQLDDKLKLYWKISDDKSQIEFAVDCDCTGWVAFGPSKSGKMKDSDVVLGYFENGNLVIDDYYITDYSGSCPGVCKDTNPKIGGVSSILDFNGNQNNGKTQIKWIRKLNTGDSAGDVEIVDGEMNAIWGFHPSNNFISQHNSNTKSPIKINFFSGESSTGVDLKAVHGILMFLAWSVFVLGTSFIARYLKRFGWWFNVHRYINSAMMMAVIAAFGIAIAFTADGQHFNKPHSVIGLIVVIIAIAQPIIGIVADKLYDKDRTSTPIFPDKSHWVLGWGGLALGLINVLLGLILYGNKGLVIAYAVWFAIVGALLLFWAVYKGIVGMETH